MGQKNVICVNTHTHTIYSAIRNNDMWFEGKCMQSEDIMLSEVRQFQKDKGYMFFSHMWKIDPKINIYTKTSMIMYKLRCRACL
jgi:N-acetylmuramoyl-L-alanine amidase CwlA